MTENENWYGSNVATFGDRVAAAREHAAIEQPVLAKRLGIRQETLRAWEEDLAEPRANRLATLAGVLGVSMMWLINGEGEGLEAPDDVEAPDVEAKDILSELRDLRTDMLRKAEQIERLERRLRSALQGISND